MDFSEVSNIASQSLDSSSCDSSVSETSSPPTKKRRANFEYDCFKTFDTLDAARDFVKTLGEFVYKKRTQNSDGDKLMYVCKSDSLCSSRLYIQLPATSTIVNVYKTTVDHDHQPTSPLSTRLHGIPMSTKSAIQELYSLGVTKPKQILRALVDKKIETPGTTQLNNYLKRLRQANTVPIDHLGALQHHIDLLSTSSDDDDEPFVLHKQFNYDDSTFGIFFTTNRLLSLIRKSDAVNIDATYKLVWNSFPCIIVGTTDKNCHFHPFGFALISNETSRDYQFVFESLRVFDSSYSPKYLIADCAQAITNGFENVFGVDYTRIHCWFHVLKNVDKRLNSILTPSKSKVLADIRILQLSRTKEEFDCACALFVTKWNQCSELQEFIQYFAAEYIEANPNWFAGAAVGFPKTNN